MRVRASLALLTLLPLSVFSIAADGDEVCTVLDAGADAEDPSDDVLACESTGYLGGCEDFAAGKYYNALAHGSAVPLVEEAPTESFRSGAGCGVVEDPVFRNTVQEGIYSFDIKGFLAANPDTLTVEMHDISASTMRASRTTTMGVRLTIEGEFPLGFEETTNVAGDPFKSPTLIQVPLTAVASESGVSDSLTFTVTNLSSVLPPEMYEAGTGEEWTVIVTIDPPRDGAHGFVWGASEVPSLVAFNAPVRGTVVDAATMEITQPTE